MKFKNNIDLSNNKIINSGAPVSSGDLVNLQYHLDDDRFKVQNTLRVKKNPGYGEFSSIKTAIDSITDNSPTNRYVVEIGPGVYIEDTITMKPYVFVIGVDSLTTRIVVDATSKNAIIGAPESLLKDIHVSGSTDIGKKSIIYTGGGVFSIVGCRFGTAYHLIDISVTSGPAGVLIKECIIDSGANFTTGITATDNGVFPCAGLVTGIILQSVMPPYSGNFFNIIGPLTRFIVENTSLINENGISTGTAFYVANGATLRMSNLNIGGYAIGVNVPNIGVAPIIYATGVTFDINNTTDLIIEHPGTFGTITGNITKSKISIVPNAMFVSLFTNDPTAGDVLISGQIYQGETFDQSTNITDQIQQGAHIGIVSGGELSVGTGLGVNVGSGKGYLMVGVHPTDYLKYVEFASQSVVLTPNADHYIYINNDGTASMTLSLPALLTVILVGKVRTDLTGITFIQHIVRQADHTASRLDRTFRLAIGPLYTSGSTVSKNGTLQLDVTNGNYFYSTHNFKPNGGSAITWKAYTKNGSGNWNVTNQTNIDFDHYDDGSGVLATTPINNYVKHLLYVINGPDETYVLVYGQQTFTTQIDAENGPVPIEPSTWSSNITRIASIVVKNTAIGADRITVIIDERPRLNFRASSSGGGGGVTNHGDLSGLSDDDHTQYLLVSGSRNMGGNLNMGTNDIVNVNLVDGVDVSTHASRHLPNGADPLTTGVPSNIGSTNSTGIANALSRQDHVHNHGAQTEPTHHAVATISANGFMASTDKIILDAATDLNTANAIVKRDISGNFVTNQITMNLGVVLNTPTNNTDIANKAYVDARVQGLTIKASVVAKSTGNVIRDGNQTVDGHVTSAGERIALFNQTTSSQDGIYIASAGGWTRATDFAVDSNANGIFFFVERGTVNANTGWVENSLNTAIVGTDDLSVVQFSGAGSFTAGNGLSLTGNQFNVVPGDNSLTATAGSLIVKQDTAGAIVTTVAGQKVNVDSTTIEIGGGTNQLRVNAANVAKKFISGSVDIGATPGAVAINHNLNNQYVTYRIYDSITGVEYAVNATATSANVLTITASGPTKTVRIVVIG